jgi:hypothetical protein
MMSMPMLKRVLSKKLSLGLTGGVVLVYCLNLLPLRAQRQVRPPVAGTESPEERSKELSTLFVEIWQDQLKHSPEFA